MDFTGTALLEPDKILFKVFHGVFTVYETVKQNIVSLSFSENIGKEIALTAFRYLRHHKMFLQFCCTHQVSYMFALVFSTVKTFLKAFVIEANQKHASDQQKKAVKKKDKKDRKHQVLIGNKI